MKRIDTSEFTFDKINDFEDEYEKLKFSVAFNNRKNAFFEIDSVYNLDSIINRQKNTETLEIIEIKKYKPNDD